MVQRSESMESGLSAYGRLSIDEKAEGNTRIDWAIMSLVKERIEEVVPLVKAELPSLAVLTAVGVPARR
jgi:hypothetical protein